MLFCLSLKALDKGHELDFSIIGEFLFCFFFPVCRGERPCLNGVLNKVDLNYFDVVVEDGLKIGWDWRVLLMKGL